jgi:hypothetical protein
MVKNKKRSLSIESRKLQTSLLLLVCLLFASCSDQHWFDITKSTGEEITVTRPVSDNFAHIKLYNDIDLVITQSKTYSIKVTGGENLLPGVETTISDSVLSIRNLNTFNWVRSYDRKITVFVSMPHLLQLNYEATGTVSNTDTIREDSLFVIATGGSGYINLTLKTGSTHYSINTGSVDIISTGITGVNYLYSSGYGRINCSDLISAYTFVSNHSSNDCFIHANYHIGYNITGLGNIYYKGTPLTIEGQATGEGKLIKRE